MFPQLVKKLHTFHTSWRFSTVITRPFREPDDSSPSRFKICFMLFFNLCLRSSKWSLSFSFLHQYSVCICLLSHTCHMLHKSYPPCFLNVDISKLHVIAKFWGYTECRMKKKSCPGSGSRKHSHVITVTPREVGVPGDKHSLITTIYLFKCNITYVVLCQQ